MVSIDNKYFLEWLMRLTSDLTDGLEVLGRAVLQGQSDRTSSVGPSDIEGLTRLNTVEVAVGDEDSANPGRESGEENGENDRLHLDS